MVLLEVVQYAGLQNGGGGAEASVDAPAVCRFELDIDVGHPVFHRRRFGTPEGDDRRVGPGVPQQNSPPVGTRIIHHTDVRRQAR